MGKRVPMFFLPFGILGITRVGIEISVRVLPMTLAWIPAMLVYYLAIEGAVWWVRSHVPAAQNGLSFAARPAPRGRSLVFGVVLPALLPFGFFILNVKAVPPAILAAIVVFALINPYFEEVFWRGLLAYLPTPDGFRIFYSGLLFGFSHWFLWGAYWLSNPRVLVAVVTTTFVMGVAWMWFYLRERSLFYTMASHFFVDVFNLSVAMFIGIRLRTV